jgi:hypothetical protein
MKKTLFLAFLFFSLQPLFGQGLENVIVETYYISDANDATDTDGGSLPEGSVTYRIYLDLAPNYKLESVFGNSEHELRIETTTLFFNNEDRGELTGDLIGDNRLDDNTVALDSWLTIGAASESHFGVLKTDDPDGSIVGGVNNDGGSEGIPGGLLVNDDPAAGIPLTTADGLIDGTVSGVQLIAADASIFDVFDNENAGPVFSTNNGAWAVLGGLEGQTSENRILVAQITTDGELSFSLNVRVNTLQGGGQIDYVSSDPIGDQVFFPALNFPLVPVEGCTDPNACNFDPSATDDDGSCLIPVENCTECDGEELVLIDDDGDGVCNADEVEGCTDPVACNFDPNATEEDGSCLIPEPDCTECDGEELVLIDDDGDGVCNAEEIIGCTDPVACNFDPNATDDDGTCLVPEPDCTECDGEDLVLIDDDGDGVCNAEEVFGCTDPEAINFNPNATEDDGSCEYEGVAGCTSPTACNFNPDATADDGSCLEPVPNCTECDGEELVLIDDDGDGVCNADEIDGCTEPTACNFDPDATDDDGSCLVPEPDCTECDGEELVLIDDDGDGICNAQEIDGCTDPEACNFDPNATDDDGSCLIPEPDCTECDGQELVLIDDDGDGICNAEEIDGCTDPEACNFDPEATDDDGSCLIPEPDCTECDGEELVLIDDDGDGICNAEEIDGCTEPTACNFDPEATDDDGSCLIPEPDCTECDGEELVLIDDDGDGVCNAQEVFGCTDPDALNFDPEATEDDGSCLYLSTTDLESTSNILAVYPNPAVDRFWVEQVARDMDLTKARYAIYDILGNRIDADVISLSGAGDKRQILLPDLASGLYIFELINDQDRYVMRLVKP